MSRSAVLALFVFAGCSADGLDPVAAACGGVRPALDECTTHVFDADCGGTGEPTFACSEDGGGCRWFATGCIASAHHVSDCPAGDLCCHTTEDGAWPFADGWTHPIGPYHEETLADIETLASTVVTATSPANLELTIDPTVAPGTRMVTCAGVSWPGLCSRPAIVSAGRGAHDSFVVSTLLALYGPTVVAEVVGEPSGPLVARAFIGFQNDASLLDPPSQCRDLPYPLGPVTSGTLTISGTEDGAHGILTIDVEGGTVSVSF